MRLRLAATLLLLVHLAPLPAQAAEEVVDLSIDKVLKPPLRYDGKLIRVRGVLNECVRFSCLLCQTKAGELPTGDHKCLRPEFDLLGDGKGGDDESGGRTEKASEELYRFAEITAIGRYDAKCDLGRGEPDPKDDKIQNLVVCTDRATNFRIVQVVAVHKRWPASKGLMTLYGGLKLSAANAADSARIVDAFNTLQAAEGWKIDIKDRTKVFRVERDPNGDPNAPDKAFLCQCDDDSCEGTWPTRAGQIIATMVQPFQCVAAYRVKNAWVFPPRLE